MKKSLRTKFALLAVGALALNLVVGCAKVKPTVAPQALPVSVQKVQLSDKPQTDTYLGNITSYVQTVVAPAISGILSSVNVRVGDVVKPGDVLAALDTDILQAQRQQAAANKEATEFQQKTLAEKTANNLDQYKAALEAAETNLANAQSAANASILAVQKSNDAQLTNANNAVAAAQKAVTTAETQLKNAQVNYDNSITNAQNNVASAKAKLDAAIVAVQNDQASLVKAQDVLQTALTQLNLAKQTSHSTTAPALLQAQTTYDNAAMALQTAQNALSRDEAAQKSAETDYNNALSNLETIRNSQAVATAQAQLDQAKQTLASALETQKSVQAQLQAALEQATTSANNNIAAMKAALAQAQTNYENALKDPNLKVNQAQIEAAQAGVQVIEAQIEKGQITAPIGGYVVAVNAQVGQAVGPQGGFITISSMNPLMATLDVPESSIGKIQPGMPMEVYVPSTKENLPGQVNAIHPAPDSTSKKYAIDVTIKGNQEPLLPGLRVEGRLVNQGEKAIMIPADCVLSTQSGATSVFVIKDGVAHSQIVKVGMMTGSMYEITSGLDVGEDLVIQGQNLLSDGDKVKVVTLSGKS